MVSGICKVCGSKKNKFVSGSGKKMKGGANPAALAAAGQMIGDLGNNLIGTISNGVSNLQQNTGVYDREKLRKDMKLFDDMTMNYYISAQKDGNPILAGEARKLARETLRNRGIYV